MSFNFANFRKAQEANVEKETQEAGFDAPRETIKAASKPASKARAKPTKAKSTAGGAGSKKRSKPDGESEVVVRRSTRSRVAKASTEEEKEDLRARNEAEQEALKAEARRQKHVDRPIEALRGVTDAGDQDSLEGLLRELASFRMTKKEKEGGEDGWVRGERPALDAKRLTEEVEPLGLRTILKVVPDRIYSLCVHPDPTKDLVFAGDKTGHIGVWDATDAGKLVQNTSNGSILDGEDAKMDEDEEEQEEPERSKGRFWVWQGHQQNSVSSLKFRPNETNKIYSSSYDATVRVHDFTTGTSEEVLDCDEFVDEGLIHTFDFDPTGNEIWASDGEGGLMWRDLRQSKDKTKRWQIDKAKVGCISINPANPTLAATSHLKRELRLWDLSKLRALPTKTHFDDVVDKAMVVSYPHEKAVTSAYFDPSGTRLASTSYDDCIRIWDIDPYKPDILSQPKKFNPKKTIDHNCQVGAYVTVLRARWSTVSPSISPPHLHVGDMRRHLDLYSPDGARVKAFSSDEITAVPAVTASHPSLPGKYYGGAASGKVSFWTTEVVEE
ncbi:hypothetical protein JCM5296_002996 [Sporobolomyces johnsonii]